MSKRHTFTVELQEDVVVSAKAATLGNHECLDHLPGSVFLGAAARKFYVKWLGAADTRDWPFRAFHSGQVRFGPAFPVDADGSASVPMPACWHYPKTGALENDAQNVARKPWDFATQGQEKQARSGWLSGEDRIFTTAYNFRMKTSIGRSFDQAQTGALFGYSSLPAGTRFRAFIDSNADEDELWDALVGCFAEGETLWVGRSRNAEFGEAKIVATGDSVDFPASEEDGPGDGVILIHALSDLALVDQNAQPVFSLGADDLENLGLAGAKPDWEHTFIRTRVYSPFNHHRNAPDLERQVIAKGSVLAVTGVSPPEPGFGWIGAYQHDGLGWVAIDPPYLRAEHPNLAKTEPWTPTKEQNPGLPVLPFASVMQRRHKDRQDHLEAIALGREWGDFWAKGKPCPSSSQWARVRQAAIQSATLKDLRDTLYGAGEAIFTHGASGQKKWKLDDPRSAAARVKRSLKNYEGSDAVALAACREAAIHVARKKNH